MRTSISDQSKAQVIVLTIIHEKISVAEAAHRFGVSRSWIYLLLSRFKEGGVSAIAPGSRRPHSNSRAMSSPLREAICATRIDLVSQGLDAGGASIAWHLKNQGLHPPALSTIYRTLRQAGLIIPEPKKRPKAYIQRFEAIQPNETWQSDFTHWRLANGRDVEIINWLDDHSRLLLHCTAHSRVTGAIVVGSFTELHNQYGIPFSTLTDNGVVYTARFREGSNEFEYLLADLGVVQKNGHPGHPQTQGKIERFHQTLKKWLLGQERAKNIKELQTQLDRFREIYNTQRPHKALEMRTPQQSYEATIKATPDNANVRTIYRTRLDTVDQFGKISLRRAGKMHHLGVGIEEKFKKVILVIDHYGVKVVERKTGEVLSQHRIKPSQTYWTNELLSAEEKATRRPKEIEKRSRSD